MGHGFRIGTLLGIPIRIDYSWLIIFGIISFSLTVGFFPAVPNQPLPVYLLFGVLTTLLFFGSVLAHELSHSVVARAKGLPVGGITLFIFGGVSQLEEEPSSPRVEFVMAFVGPLTSVVLGVLFLVIWIAAGAVGNVWLQAVTKQLWFINFALAAFNLLPGFPLDGGRLLRAAVWHVSGDLRVATQAATIAGQVLAYVLIGIGILIFFRLPGAWLSGVWLAFIGLFLLQAAQQSYRQMVFRTALTGVPVGDLARRDTVAVPPELSVQNLVDDYLLRHAANLFPVVAEGRVLGTVGMNDIHGVPREDWPATPVSRIMHPVSEEEVVSEHLDAWDAVQRLGKTDCECLLLMDDDRLDGIVTRDSLLRWVHTQRQLGG